MVNSRAKGARAERAAAEYLSALTGKVWYRTAQRCGIDTADVRADGVPIHVEVKHYASGLSFWARRSEGQRLSLGGDLFFCRADHLPRVCRQQDEHHLAPRSMLAEGFMRQAVRDCGTLVPLVLAKQNNSHWIAIWRHSDDDLFSEIVRSFYAN